MLTGAQGSDAGGGGAGGRGRQHWGAEAKALDSAGCRGGSWLEEVRGDGVGGAAGRGWEGPSEGC